MVIKIILIVFFLVMSAFFSGSEIAYSKVNHLKLERDALNKDKKSIRALNVYNNFDKVLSTILVGNNLVNIAMSSVCGVVALEIATGLPESLVATITTIIVTFIVLIFGEILPKTICQNYSYSLSRIVAPILLFFNFIFTPIVIVVNLIVDKLSKPFNNRLEEDEEDNNLDEELKNMTDELKKNGAIDGDDEELINSAIDFINKTAWEIMIPRVDVNSFDIEDGFNNIINEEDFYDRSRVIIYKETIDSIIGIVSTTDVLKRKLNHESVELSDVLYEPLYVHKTMLITDVLNNLKEKHLHIAIVLDEWGGVMGIVTLEDILEELFGDIWDEIDDVEPEFIEINDDLFIIDGDMNINDFFDLVGYDDRDFESDYSTVGGWCTDVLEKFPEANDTFEFENLSIIIKEVDGPRVVKVLCKVNETINDEE